MKAYSEDLRTRVLTAVNGGMTRAHAATTFQVSVSSIKRWRSQQVDVGHLRPKRPSGRPRLMGVTGETSMRVQLIAQPDATLSEHLTVWKREQGTAPSRWTISRTIKRLGWSRKKRL